MAQTAEQVLKNFGWRHQPHLGSCFQYGAKPGIVAGAQVGDEKVTFDIHLSIPVNEIAGTILSLMTAMYGVEQVATIDIDEPASLPLELAVEYVAKVWFPAAATNYVVDHAEDFISDGAVSLDESNLFKKVMEHVFWSTVNVVMDDPEDLENAIYAAVDDSVFKSCRERLEEIAADWRSQKNINAQHGVCQSDFLG